jgi:hypothetical protein
MGQARSNYQYQLPDIIHAAGYMAGGATRRTSTLIGPLAGHTLPKMTRPRSDLELGDSSRDNTRLYMAFCHDMICLLLK